MVVMSSRCMKPSSLSRLFLRSRSTFDWVWLPSVGLLPVRSIVFLVFEARRWPVVMARRRGQKAGREAVTMPMVTSTLVQVPAGVNVSMPITNQIGSRYWGSSRCAQVTSLILRLRRNVSRMTETTQTLAHVLVSLTIAFGNEPLQATKDEDNHDGNLSRKSHL